MRGENDDQLKWPFRGDVTIQLVNQTLGAKHAEDIISFNDKAVEYGSANRVTSGEGSKKAWGNLKFITHCKVESNNQFVHNDQLAWRVTKVVVRSI